MGYINNNILYCKCLILKNGVTLVIELIKNLSNNKKKYNEIRKELDRYIKEIR